VEKDTPPVADVLAHGQPVGQSVGGAVLEAAFALDGFYLLFMTDDLPYEEGLTIHLLRDDYEYVESVGLAWPYATGHLRDVTVVDKNRVSFRFFDARVITLTVTPRAGWRLPFMPEFAGVFRPFGVRRHMRVQRAKA
jgi:hypothetical protein